MAMHVDEVGVPLHAALSTGVGLDVTLNFCSRSEAHAMPCDVHGIYLVPPDRWILTHEVGPVQEPGPMMSVLVGAVNELGVWE